MEKPPTRFTVDAARRSGLSRSRIDSLPAPYWGVRSSEDAGLDLETRARDLLPRLSVDARYSHGTAAVLKALPLPRRLELDLRLHVTHPVGHRAPQARHVIGHENATEPDDIEWLAGLPVSSAPRLFREMSALLGLGDLIALADAMITGDHPACTIADLERSVRMNSGFRGRRTALAAVPQAAVGAESRPETFLRLAVIRAGLPAVLVNSEIRDPAGRFVARPDLLFRDFPLSLEYEGYHHADPARFRQDVVRTRRLRAAGIDQIQATSDDLPSFERVIDETGRRLRLLGWDGTPPHPGTDLIDSR